MSYVISCCSTADMTEQHFKARDIHYLCFHFSLDGVNYPDDLGKSVPFEDFYQAMANGADTRTSQVNVDEYMAYFRSFLEEGKDILHVAFSSGLSGACNSARIAREELLTCYPERQIYIVDSLSASSGYGLLMDRLADLRDEGMGLAELAQWAEDHKLNVNHWFYSTDLSFYVKGGRISKASGWFGTALKICPLLNMNNEGKLCPRFKVRGKNAVMHRLVEQMVACAEDGKNYSGKCYLSHSGCAEDAAQVVKLVEEAFPQLTGKIETYYIGTTIGSHTGPGTVALFFWGEKRGA